MRRILGQPRPEWRIAKGARRGQLITDSPGWCRRNSETPHLACTRTMGD